MRSYINRYNDHHPSAPFPWLVLASISILSVRLTRVPSGFCEPRSYQRSINPNRGLHYLALFA